MSRILDITSRLTFEAKPQLAIRGTVIEVNNDAPTMLRIMGLMSEDDLGAEKLLDAYKLLFSEHDRAKLDQLRLSFRDLMVIIQSAMDLIKGEDSVGETQTPTMTSSGITI